MDYSVNPGFAKLVSSTDNSSTDGEGHNINDAVNEFIYAVTQYGVFWSLVFSLDAFLLQS